jgi:DNA-binding SARP family transcriptional activator
MSAAAEPTRPPERGCVCTLGPLTVTGPGEPVTNGCAGLGRSPSRLLAALVAVGPGGASRGRLIRMVWDVPMETRTLGRLRTTLSRLRTALAASVRSGDVIVEAPPSRLRLNDLRVRVDAWQLLERAGDPGRDVEADLALLLAARGPFAAGQGGAAWLEAYRICCREAFRALTEHAVGGLAAAGRADEARRLAARARAVDPPAGPPPRGALRPTPNARRG